MILTEQVTGIANNHRRRRALVGFASRTPHFAARAFRGAAAFSFRCAKEVMPPTIKDVHDDDTFYSRRDGRHDDIKRFVVSTPPTLTELPTSIILTAARARRSRFRWASLGRTRDRMVTQGRVPG